MSQDTESPDVEGAVPRQDLPAGDFSLWLRGTRRALAEKGSAGVPCGDCTGCCTSSYFIHIGPDESQTLRRIPKKLRFPAPGLPKGQVVLGYDEKGRCPMLKGGTCSIYEDRPQTCRAYDCRVFPAAGIEAGDDGQEMINQRVRRWRFSYPTEGDRQEHLAVQAATTFLQEHTDCLPDGFVSSNPAQLAVLAVKVCDAFFVGAGALEGSGRLPTDIEVAEAVIEKARQFEPGRPEEPAVRPPRRS